MNNSTPPYYPQFKTDSEDATKFVISKPEKPDGVERSIIRRNKITEGFLKRPSHIHTANILQELISESIHEVIESTKRK